MTGSCIYVILNCSFKKHPRGRPQKNKGETMNWTITLIICGLFVIASATCTVRFGSNHVRMRDFWAFVASFVLGVVSLFYLPLYVACICWLVTSGAAWTPVWRAYKHRNDKKPFVSPELHQSNRPMGKVVPFNSTESDDDSPGAA